MSHEYSLSAVRRNDAPQQALGGSSASAIPLREFVRIAAMMGVHIPENLRPDRYGAIDLGMTREASPLIEELVSQGELTVILEGENVERNLVSSKLLAALGRREDVLPRHWRNLTSAPVQRVAFIDIERRRRYVEFLRLFGECGNGERDLLFHAGFLEKTVDEGLRDFKNAIQENNPRVVIFDTEKAPGETRVEKQLFREALRHCLYLSIAIVVILLKSSRI